MIADTIAIKITTGEEMEVIVRSVVEQFTLHFSGYAFQFSDKLTLPPLLDGLGSL